MHYSVDSTLSERVYLDHNATTPPSALLKSKWSELFELWGNPSSIHTDSRGPKQYLRETRQKISQYLECSTLELIFNSGASEGNSTILNSVWLKNGKSRPEFLISSVEHPSVIKTAHHLISCGAQVHFIPVFKSGQIDLQFIKEKLSDKTALVSVMFANNETGTLFPISEIAEMAHHAGALMHSDCVQMLGKSLVSFKSLHLDYATFSGHKFYGLKGAGFVYARKAAPWIPSVHGGGQERSRRGGTENILGIASIGISIDQFDGLDLKIIEMARLRDLLEKSILEKIDHVFITCGRSARLGNTSNMILDGVDGETLLMSLDLKGFSVSTGAACSSGSPEPSPVLLALGLTRAQAQNSLRVSLGWSTTEKQIHNFTEALVEVVKKLRALNQSPNKNLNNDEPVHELS